MGIQSGIRAGARQLPFKKGSLGEIVAINPFIPNKLEVLTSMMGYCPEATRVFELGGKFLLMQTPEPPVKIFQVYLNLNLRKSGLCKMDHWILGFQGELSFV